MAHLNYYQDAGDINQFVSIDNDQHFNFELYPNPSNGIININSSVKTTVDIYNISGKLLHSAIISLGNTLNLSECHLVFI